MSPNLGRPLRALLSMAALLVLQACGPGTGGTGTGRDADYLALAGASAAPVCASAWAQQSLACVSTGGAGAGTAALQFSSGGPQPDYVLRFEGNAMQLLGGCPRLSFDGDWGLLPSGVSQFFGGYLQPSMVSEAAATLTVSAAEAGQLRVELRAADGRLLLGPLLVSRVSGAELQPKPC